MNEIRREIASDMAVVTRLGAPKNPFRELLQTQPEPARPTFLSRPVNLGHLLKKNFT